MSTPGERCEKLKNLLKPTEEHPWGRSSNSVAVEIGVYLNLFVAFLKTNGSPEKWNIETQSYSSKPLNKLIKWIDSQDDPIVIKAKTSKPTKTSKDSNDLPIERKKRISSAAELDDFLESVDVKFRAYADKIIWFVFIPQHHKYTYYIKHDFIHAIRALN